MKIIRGICSKMFQTANINICESSKKPDIHRKMYKLIFRQNFSNAHALFWGREIIFCTWMDPGMCIWEDGTEC